MGKGVNLTGMNERLLQFIWQFQYFNQRELQLFSGEPFSIAHTGQFNSNQGPDFLHATIRIGGAIVSGNIELHVKTSDWHRHAHDDDVNYRNVILHVVWTNDMPQTESSLPLLELQDRIPKLLLQQYTAWMTQPTAIPCAGQLTQVNELVWSSWKERLLVERLTKKMAVVETCLSQNNFHWEETFWWLIARNFGITVNANTFEAIARSIPVNILGRHKNQIHQVEALLFGQAGLLEKQFAEKYPRMLKREYHFLQKKYGLIQRHKPVQFLRMRPMNFPTVRLAQLAMLIHQSSHLFSIIKETTLLREIRYLLQVTANDYWHTHYLFDETAEHAPKRTGEAMVNNIVINTVTPILFAYARASGEKYYQQKAMQWLEELPPENNTIVREFLKLGVRNTTAFDSQALVELRGSYCNAKRCLDCAVGNAILKRNHNT